MNDPHKEFTSSISKIKANITKQGKREYTLTSRATNGNRIIQTINAYIEEANKSTDRTLFEQTWSAEARTIRYALYALNIALVIPSRLPREKFSYLPPELKKATFPIDPEISGPELHFPIVISSEEALGLNLLPAPVLTFSETEMAAPKISELDFIKPFSGESTKVKSFLNSIKLAVSQYPDHKGVILSFVKTRLEGTALSLTEDIDNLDDLASTINSNFNKPEAISVVTSELSNLQPKRNQQAYLSEVKSLATRLQICHIASGVPVEYASKIAEQAGIQSIYMNCNDRRLKAILAGQMSSTLDEVTATYNREFNVKYALKPMTSSKQEKGKTFNNKNKNFKRNDNYNNRNNNNSNNNNGHNSGNRRNNNSNSNSNNAHFARPLTGNAQSSQAPLASVNN